jgi:S-formylglutathione hydrolase FrmB
MTRATLRGGFDPRGALWGAMVVVAFSTSAAWAQDGKVVQEGKIIREKVHAAALEKTVTGESPDRWVSVYLPPSYDGAPTKRYPVLYLLHGIGDTDEVWTNANGPLASIQDLMNQGIAAGKFGKMIIVMPDEQTNMAGSFYRNSPVTGNWEDFTVKELVAYIDKRYRTIAKAASRGIAGHSMGGHGAITLGMKYPDVFQVVYGMNPAVLGWGGDVSIQNKAFRSVLAMKSFDELAKGGVYPLGITCISQAFSPNPDRPPFFVDYPFELVDGKLRPAEPGYNKWDENLPVNMAKRYRVNLSKLRGLRFDSGYEDEFTHIPVSARAFSFTLTNLGIDHDFEEYNGDHRDRLRGPKGRLYTHVFPYFWSLLESEKENAE